MRVVGLVAALAIAGACYAEEPKVNEPEKKKTPRWQRNFEKRDKNQDGKLDKEEFRSKAFSRFDKDNDGFISLEEYKKVHRHRRRMRRKKGQQGNNKRRMWPKKWIKLRDKDKDGKVSKDEHKGKPEFFAKFDTDKDGFLSLEEVRKMPRFRKRAKGKNFKGKRNRRRNKRHIKGEEPKTDPKVEEANDNIE